MEKYRHYIDGEFVEPSSGSYFKSFDPYLGRAPGRSSHGAARRCRARRRGGAPGLHQRRVAGLTASQRGALLRRLGDLVAREREAAGRRSKCATTAS